MIRADNAIHESLKACLSSLNVAEQEAARLGDNIDRLRAVNAELVAALETLINAASHPVPESMNATEARRAALRISRVALARAKEQ